MKDFEEKNHHRELFVLKHIMCLLTLIHLGSVSVSMFKNMDYNRELFVLKH